MKIKKKNLYSYLFISLFIFVLSLGQVNASEYVNYYGISMTSQQYNNLLQLGFSENEIYYMLEETFESNKDLNATLISKNDKYYKTIYTGLDGESYSMEVTENEYNNQSHMDARGTVNTEYKNMVTVISQNGNYFRYKVSVNWNRLPSVRSYDIIGIGFDDDVYIASFVNFNYTYCTTSSSNCTTSTLYYDKKKLSTGGSVVYKLPGSEARSLGAVLYYDVAKDTTDTITRLDMYGDYSHATESVSSSVYTDYTINRYGIVLGTSSSSSYDAIPTAQSTWGGTW